MAWYPKIVTVKKDGTTGSEYPFPKGRCSVGGIAGCDIHIRGAGTSHCLFIVDKNKQAHIVNVTGTADVIRNGEGIDNESFLSHGDVVQIGSRKFRFEWVEKRKKGHKNSEVAGASQQSKAAGDARESSALQNEDGNEAHPEQRSNGTPGTCTPTTNSFDQSLFKTPRIPPEMFVSPLSASFSDQQECNGGEDGPRSGGLGNSQLISSSSSTPLIDEPRMRALHSSTSSTPLLDEPRTRTTRSRISLAGMVNSPSEQEQPVFQERQSCSPLKRRSQSCQTGEEKSSKLRRSESYGPARRSGRSSRSSSAEDGADGQHFTASTPVARTHVRSSKALKGMSFLHQEKKTGFATPGSQSCYTNGNTATDESRRALRSSQSSLCHASLSASADSLGFESLFITPIDTGSASKKQLGSFMAQDMSNSSFGTKRGQKGLSHLAHNGSKQRQAKSVAASPVSSRSRHSLEKNTNGARMPSEQCTTSTIAKSSLGKSSEYTASVGPVATAAETIDSLERCNSGGHSSTSTLGFLEQEKGASAKKTGSKHTTSAISTSSFKESPEDKRGPAKVSVRAAKSSFTNSAAASPSGSELCSQGGSQDILCVTADDSRRATRSTAISCIPNNASASNKKSQKPESPEQEGAVTSEKGNEKGGVPRQAVRDLSQSDQESLEHMGVVEESPSAGVRKRPSRASASKKVCIEALEKETKGMLSLETPQVEQTMQCSSQTLENELNSALEKSALPTRKGRFSHTLTSKEMRVEASELETVGAPSPSKASRSRRTLPSRHADEEPNHATVSALSPGHVNLENVDVAARSIRTRSARFSHELVSTEKDGKALEHKAGHTPTALKSSAANEAPLSKNMGTALEGSFGCSRSTRSSTSLGKHTSLESEKVKGVENGQGQQAGTSPSKQESLFHVHGVIEESVRATRSSGTLTSSSVVLGTPGRAEVGLQNSMRGSETKQVPVLRKTKAQALETLNTPKFPKGVGGKRTPASSQLNTSKEVTEEDVAGTSLTEHTPLVNTGSLMNQSSRSHRSNRAPVSENLNKEEAALDHSTEGRRNPSNASRTRQSVSGKGKTETPQKIVVDTPKSLQASAAKRTPTSGVTPNPVGAASAKQAAGGKANNGTPQQQMAGTPKSLKDSAAKQASTSAKIIKEQEDLKQATRASSLKRVSFDDTCGVTEGSIRSTRSSLSSCKNGNVETPGLEDGGSQKPARGSRVPRRSKETLPQETLDTPEPMQTSGGKQEPASGKISADDTSEQDVSDTSPFELFPQLCITPVVVESGSAQRTRPSRTPATEKSNGRALMFEAVGVTPNSLKGTGQKKATSRKVNCATPQQAAVDSPLSLKASTAKRTSASSNIMEKQEGLKQAARASSSESVSFDDICAATEGSVRSTRSSLSSSRNGNIDTPGLEDGGSQEPMRGSRVSRKSKEAVSQKTLDTPEPMQTSGGKQTPALGKISADEDSSEEDVSDTSPFKLFPQLSITPVVVESGGARSTRPSRALAKEKSNGGAFMVETVDLTPNSLKGTGQRKAVSRKVNCATPQQEAVGSPMSLKASTAKRTSASSKIMEKQEGPKQAARASSSKPVSFDDICAATKGSVRSTRSSLSSRNGNIDAPGLDDGGSQEPMRGSRISRKSKEAVSQKTLDAPEPMQTSGGKQTPTSGKISAVEDSSEEDVSDTSPFKLFPQLSITPVVVESGRARSKRSSRTPTTEKSNGGALMDEIVDLTPDSLKGTGQKKAVSGKLNSSTAQLQTDTPLEASAAKRRSIKTAEGTPNPLGAAGAKQMASTPKSLKASPAKTSPCKNIMEEQGVVKKTTRSSPSKRVSFDNSCAGTEELVRPTRSGRSLAPSDGNVENLGLEKVGSQSAIGRVSQKSKDILEQETLGTQRCLRTSAGKQTPPWGKISADEEDSEQDVRDTSPFKLFPLVTVTPVVLESERTRHTRSSRTPASKKSNEGASRDERVGLTPNSLKVTGPKRAASGKKEKETPQQQAADALKSGVTSLTAERASTSKNVVEENLEQKTGASSSNQVPSNDMCVLVEESVRAARSSRTPASRNVSTEIPGLEEVPLQEFMGGSEVKRSAVSRKNKKASAQKPLDTPKSSKTSGMKQVQASDKVIADERTLEEDTMGTPPSVKEKKEATVGSNQKPSGKAKRTQASKRAAAAKETTELEKAGVSPSKRMAFDNSDATVAASGRATRAARSRYAETLKSADVKTPGQEVEVTASLLKDAGAEQTLASNQELGESTDVEAVDTNKPLRKVVRARTTRSTRKVNNEEEVPELEPANLLASKRSSATNVHVLAEEPVKPTRNTRGCRTRGSRKENVEVPEEKTSDHTQSAKATRVKRTRGAMSSTSQGKDATSDKELQGKVSPTEEVTITRKTRGKRKLDLKEEAIAEEHNTAEEVIGIIAVKRGRRQQPVTSTKDAPQESDAQLSSNAELDRILATTSEPKRSKRIVPSVKVGAAQAATVETPKKTRGRRAKALETVLDDDKHGASQETEKEHSEEAPPARRTRKKV